VVNVTELALHLGQILQTVAEFLGGEDVAWLHLEQPAQEVRRAEQFHAFEIDFGEVVTLAFFNRDGDVFNLARLVLLDDGDVEATGIAADIANLQRVIESFRGEVALLLVSITNAFFVFFQLRGIERLGENVFEVNGIRDPERVQIFHRSDDIALREGLAAPDDNLPDLDLRAFNYCENDFQRGRGNAAQFRGHGGKLMAVF